MTDITRRRLLAVPGGDHFVGVIYRFDGKRLLIESIRRVDFFKGEADA